MNRRALSRVLLCAVVCSWIAPGADRASGEEAGHGSRGREDPSIRLMAGGRSYRLPRELVTGVWTGADSFSFNFVVSPRTLAPVVNKFTPGLLSGTIDVNRKIPPLRTPREVLETFFAVHGEGARKFRQYEDGIRGYFTEQTVHDEIYEYTGPDGTHFVWGCPPQLTAVVRSCTVIRSWDQGRFRAAYSLPWEYRLQVPEIDLRLLALVRSLEVQQ